MSELNEQSPEQIEAEIERTRAEVRDDVDALQEKLSPTAAAKRGANRVQESLHNMRETLMGGVEDGQAKAQAGLSRAGDSVQEGVERTKESVVDAGHRAQRTARGNPMAVGLAAFAVGWLVASLLPSSSKERRAARNIQESDVTEPLVDSARSVAQSAGEHAKEAASEIGQEAKEAVANVTDSAKSAAEETKASASAR